jgi:hypothetical protein
MSPPDEQKEPRERLAKLLDERRAELRMRWRDVAERAGITVEGLRNLRVGTGRIRSTTKRGLEDALGWRPGSVDEILGGGEAALRGGGHAGPSHEPPVPAGDPHATTADGRSATFRLPLRVRGELAGKEIVDYQVMDLAWSGSRHKLIVLWAAPPHEAEDLERVDREYAAWTRGTQTLKEVIGTSADSGGD